MNPVLKTTFLLLGISALLGCATGDDEATSDRESEIKAGAVTVQPGSFRLFRDPNHVPDPECDSFTDIELKADGTVHLVDGLTGRCALTALIDPNPRSYSLSASVGACNSRIYEGARRVPLGPSSTGLARIKITDNRANTCDVPVPRVVVEETDRGPSTTKFTAEKA